MNGNAPTLLPVYLICGEDALKRETALKKLRDRVASLGDLSFNSDTFVGETAQGDEIVAACNTMPFASPVRLVVVTGSEKLAKQDVDYLISYILKPNDTTVLALVAEKLPKNSRLYKSVTGKNAKALVDCAPKSKRDLPRLVMDLGRSHGVQLTDSAAQCLLDLVGEDTIALNAQIEKLSLSFGTGQTITDANVRELVVRTAEVKPWEFVDAFSRKDAVACLQLLHRMDSVSPYALLSMCVARLRELICSKSLAQRGQMGMLAKELKMPDWRVKNHMQWARAFTEDELLYALSSAAETERAMKSGSNPEFAFEDWVLRVTCGN